MYLLYIAVLIVFVVILFSISSRVKKAAKLAFESETIETDEFSIVKPEGFINPINDESRFNFEAYSKDFGTGDAEALRQAHIFISVSTGKNFAEVCEETKKSAGKILMDGISESDNSYLIKSEETTENAPAYNFYKIIESERNQKAYELKITILQDFLDDYQNRVDETLRSFRLK
ncbi:MAG TPA: hypothetical protein VGC76_09810 [Pyrinomonadaceae bacterium]|jgi:hypothetical protein